MTYWLPVQPECPAWQLVMATTMVGPLPRKSPCWCCKTCVSWLIRPDASGSVASIQFRPRPRDPIVVVIRKQRVNMIKAIARWRWRA
jgi:hypothetical protein